jgi:hypothetical protein
MFGNPESLRFEDQIEIFPLSVQLVTIGKILSLLKAQKIPIIGWFHTEFLPETLMQISRHKG